MIASRHSPMAFGFPGMLMICMVVVEEQKLFSLYVSVCRLISTPQISTFPKAFSSLCTIDPVCAAEIHTEFLNNGSE